MNRHFAYALFAILSLAGVLPAANPEAASVYVTHQRVGSTGHGSGTVVACENGVALVLTNRHVCPDQGQSIVVKWTHGGTAFARWLCVDEWADLAALAVAVPNDCEVCPPARRAPEAGESVVQFGYSVTPGPLRRIGMALKQDGWRSLSGLQDWTASTGSQPGDSGSGVFNEKGQIVAVVWGGDTSRARCVMLRDVRRFLRGPLLRPWFPKFQATLVESPEPPLAQAPSPPQAPPVSDRPPTVPPDAVRDVEVLPIAPRPVGRLRPFQPLPCRT